MIITLVMMVILMIMMTKNIQISLVLSKNVPILGTFSWWKKGQKIRAWVNPPPLFGQCPKENVLFLMRSSLTLFCREFEYCWIYAFFVLIFWLKICACAIFYVFSKSDSSCHMLIYFGQNYVHIKTPMYCLAKQ